MEQIAAAASPNVIRSRDAGEARALMSDRFKPHRMRRLGGRAGFDFAHMSAAVPEGSFNILRYGGAVQIEPDPFGDFFMLEMPVHAGVDLEPERGDTCVSNGHTALFLGPSLRFRSVWRPGCVQLMLKLRNDAVLSRWQAAVGDPTAALPDVPPSLDLTTTEGWRIQQMMHLLQQEFERAVAERNDTLARSPLASATLDAVFAYVLRHHGYEGRSARILPVQLKRCVAFIEHNLVGDLSVSVLLGVAGTSERTLFNLFRQFLDTTPKAYVRTERLKFCRRLLLQGDLSVSQAARRAGFTHMGRFASQYRQFYGEPPSATISG